MKKFTNEDINDQLVRILSSSQLSGSNVLAEFLTFIVHETLDGRGPELKEYTIGVSALKKEISFNPQLDGIVRIHAGRLRRALKEYYYEEGIADSIIISIPKGSYMPSFEWRDSETANINIHPAPTATLYDAKTKPIYQEDKEVMLLNDIGRIDLSKYKPSVAVLPFRKMGQGEELEYFVRGLGEFLSTELTQFENLKIISHYSAGSILSHSNDVDIRKVGSLLDARYLFTGSIQSLNGLVRICVQLNCSETGDQLWARTFDKNNDTEMHLEFQAKVVDAILASVAGINGVISRHELARNAEFPIQAPRAYSLNYWYAQYMKNFDKQTIQSAKKFYEKVITDEPRNAMAMAYLSEILAGEIFLTGTNGKTDLGNFYGHAALKIDPFCQQAYQSIAINSLLKRNNNECIRMLEQGLEINPKSADYRAAMGALMIFAGGFEKGVKMLDGVIQLNSHIAWWQILSYSFYSYYRKFYQDALYWADRAEMNNVIWVPLIKAASYAQMELYKEARLAFEQIRSEFPEFSFEDPNAIRNFFTSESLATEIRDGLDKIRLIKQNQN